ncbi:MAG TPA: T9SS type A sorting domain-containing protein [Chitinophagales bacterium]|nr:T9SS type A sorting domain-containing protein [Chitinophagales bacterium]
MPTQSKIKFLTAAILLIEHLFAFSQVPSIEWQKCLGGIGEEKAYDIHKTNDDGFVVAGYADYDFGDVSGTHGGRDFWIVKVDSIGSIQWQKCLGGTRLEVAYSIQQSSDNGYIVAGQTYSNDEDVSGNHDSTGFYADYWVVKLDNSGNIQWQRCLGGSKQDEVFSIEQTKDQGYVVAGFTSSNDEDVSGNHGAYDYWIVKLNNSGNIEWQKCLGGSAWDKAYSVQQTIDGGFIIAGESQSNDGDVTGTHGAFNEDYWIVKLDSIGNLQWQKCLGGTQGEIAKSIHQTTDGGYVVAGNSGSNDGDVYGNHGGGDYWVVKVDNLGNIEWQECFGGTGEELLSSIQQTTDEGYLVVGYSNSKNGDVVGIHDSYLGPGVIDEWTVKISSIGIIQWQKCLGGSNEEVAYGVEEIKDGEYIVGGATASIDGDVEGNHGGNTPNWDCWIVKLSVEAVDSVLKDDLTIQPNPFSSATTIAFSSENSHAVIKIFDPIGRKIKNLIDENVLAGNHEIIFDRAHLSAGLYFLQLELNDKVRNLKVLIQ